MPRQSKFPEISCIISEDNKEREWLYEVFTENYINALYIYMEKKGLPSCDKNSILDIIKNTWGYKSDER